MTKLEIARVIEVLTNLKEQYNNVALSTEDITTLKKIDIKLSKYLDML